MEKTTSFKTEFGASLKKLGPFMFIAAIAAGAAFSEGSWGKFFDKTLPHYMVVFGLVWVVAALYATRQRMNNGVNAPSNDGGGYTPDVSNINPTTGSPMIGDSGIDAGGNLWGHSRD
jgi:hypothetical protein